MLINASKMNGLMNVRAWLYRVTYNLIVDYFRGANKDLFVEAIDDIPVPANPLNENYNMETAQCLLKLVEYLPVTDQEAIIESDYNGKNQRVLSQKWGLSHSGSKTKIQRARKKLKTVLQSCCEVKSDNAGNITEFHSKDEPHTKFSCLKCFRRMSPFDKNSVL